MHHFYGCPYLVMFHIKNFHGHIRTHPYLSREKSLVSLKNTPVSTCYIQLSLLIEKSHHPRIRTRHCINRVTLFSAHFLLQRRHIPTACVRTSEYIVTVGHSALSPSYLFHLHSTPDRIQDFPKDWVHILWYIIKWRIFWQLTVCKLDIFRKCS